jgi:hypothetical protein
MPRLQEHSEEFSFQQDGAMLTSMLIFPVVGWGAFHDSPLLPWPSRSSDLTPCIFVMGLHQGSCVHAPMPRDLPQLRQRTIEGVAAIDRKMLQLVWKEFNYRNYICHVTKGRHIEHL